MPLLKLKSSQLAHLTAKWKPQTLTLSSLKEKFRLGIGKERVLRIDDDAVIWSTRFVCPKSALGPAWPGLARLGPPLPASILIPSVIVRSKSSGRRRPRRRRRAPAGAKNKYSVCRRTAGRPRSRPSRGTRTCACQLSGDFRRREKSN